jgi:hypothetical protein
LLGLGELFVKGLRGIVLERQGRLANSHCGSLLAHLLALEVSFQGIKEEAVVGNAVPVEDLLLLLRSNAVVLVEEVKERALRLLQRRVGSRFQVSKIGEDALFELLRVLDWAAKGLESE